MKNILNLILLGFGIIFPQISKTQESTTSKDIFNIPFVEKNSWINQFKIEFKKKTCSAESYISTCYLIAPRECQKLIDINYSTCTHRVRIPDRIDLSEDHPFFIKELGLCLIQAIIRNEKPQSENCNTRESL